MIRNVKKQIYLYKKVFQRILIFFINHNVDNLPELTVFIYVLLFILF